MNENEYKDAGKVTITPKGDWDASTDYEYLDTVFYNHTTWLCKQNNVNNAPAKGSAYWQIMTSAALDSEFIGATDTEPGAKGIVPQPLPGDNNKVLKGNGQWADYSSGIEISWEDYQELTPKEQNEGIYFVYDYPGLGGVYFFKTKAAMDAAIENGDVPNNALCITEEDTPYVVNANEVNYDNTDSGMTATDVQGAIDELNGNFNLEFIEVTADGVKTAAQLANELFSLIDHSKIKTTSAFIITATNNENIWSQYTLTNNNFDLYDFINGAYGVLSMIRIKPNDIFWYNYQFSGDGTVVITDASGKIFDAGRKFKIIY